MIPTAAFGYVNFKTPDSAWANVDYKDNMIQSEGHIRAGIGAIFGKISSLSQLSGTYISFSRDLNIIKNYSFKNKAPFLGLFVFYLHTS